MGYVAYQPAIGSTSSTIMALWSNQALPSPVRCFTRLACAPSPPPDRENMPILNKKQASSARTRPDPVKDACPKQGTKWVHCWQLMFSHRPEEYL
jgi:hypothetical protein